MGTMATACSAPLPWAMCGVTGGGLNEPLKIIIRAPGFHQKFHFVSEEASIFFVVSLSAPQSSSSFFVPLNWLSSAHL